MTATSTTALVPLRPAFSDAERLALAGFLAGYRGLTREAYALDLRQFTGWCRARFLSLLAVRRADIEGFARDLKSGAAPVRPSPGGCAPSPGSTGTRSKKNSLSIPPQPTSAVRESITSRTPSPSIATTSAPCWSLPGLVRRASMR